MSRNIRLSAADRVRTVVLALMVALGSVTSTAFANAGTPPPLPAAITTLAPTMKLQGGGEITYFGISIYDGWYWSAAPGWPLNGPCALDLHYHRNLDGAKIAARSVEEIAKLGLGTPADRQRWGEAMLRIFPDVKQGDRLTGVSDGTGLVRYFHNGKAIGEIRDPGFADAFFGIWLHPNTSRADFRQKLLGAP